MAHFAEINNNGIVLRVVNACNQDIENNGGEQSEQAAEHFKTICPLSSEGVKWVQTSYNNNFRKQYAGIGDIYDVNKDKFLKQKPYPSWVLDANDDWQAPSPKPITYNQNVVGPNNTILNDLYYWDEIDKVWKLSDLE
jgi:hypothetical protein